MKSQLWKEFSSVGSLVTGGETATFPGALIQNSGYEVKAGEARLNKRIDELGEDRKTSEARQREDVKELREKIDALPLKIMELLRQPVTPNR